MTLRMWVGVAVLAALVILTTGFTWWTLTRPDLVAAQRHHTALLEQSLERKVKDDANARLAQMGTSFRLVHVACTRDGLTSHYFCFAGGLSAYGQRACYGIRATLQPRTGRFTYTGSRLPMCPGDQAAS